MSAVSRKLTPSSIADTKSPDLPSSRVFTVNSTTLSFLQDHGSMSPRIAKPRRTVRFVPAGRDAYGPRPDREVSAALRPTSEGMKHNQPELSPRVSAPSPLIIPWIRIGDHNAAPNRGLGGLMVRIFYFWQSGLGQLGLSGRCQLGLSGRFSGRFCRNLSG